MIDLLPTCLDVAGVPYPARRNGQALTPVAGRSLVPALRGERLGVRELYFEHQGNAAARIGEWKLVRAHGEPWELYDLSVDRTELSDLSSQHPRKSAQLQAKWHAWAESAGVQPWPIKRPAR